MTDLAGISGGKVVKGSGSYASAGAVAFTCSPDASAEI